MNANSLAAWQALAPGTTILDPSPGNTTVGAGVIPDATNGQVRLNATQASTQEQRTLLTPQNAGIMLLLRLDVTAGAQLKVNANQKINNAGNTHILFTAVDQCCMLVSVPYSVGTVGQSFRWQVVFNDGPTLS